jgi:hypothetical protein
MECPKLGRSTLRRGRNHLPVQKAQVIQRSRAVVIERDLSQDRGFDQLLFDSRLI